VIGDDVEGVALWPVDGQGKLQRIPGSIENDRPVTFTQDGRSLWMFQRGAVPAQFVKLNVVTGERQAKALTPADVAGVHSITEFAITPEGDAYFYSYLRRLSQLYLVRGLQ
jgi:hypothetical protein